MLGALIDLLIEEGYQVWITKPLYTGVRRILSRNQFLKAFLIDTSNEDKETFIPYRKFSQTESDDFKKYIDDELISKQKFPKHTELVGRNINESIFEIYVNAITHGNSKFQDLTSQLWIVAILFIKMCVIIAQEKDLIV